MRATRLVIGLLLVTAPALATHTFVFETPIEEDAGWLTFRFADVPPDSVVRAFVRTGPPAAMGVHMFSRDGQAMDSIFGTWGGRGHSVIVFDSTTGQSVTSQADAAAPPDAFFGAGIRTTQYHPELYFATWAAGRDVRWKVMIESPAELTMLDARSGGSAFYVAGTEWGGTGAFAQVAGPTAAAGLRTQADLQVQSRLIGTYGVHPLGATAGLLTVSNATTTHLCPCVFSEVQGEAAFMPDTYTLASDGASVRAAGPLFAGADVEIVGLTT